jgi:hypothetical protein
MKVYEFHNILELNEHLGIYKVDGEVIPISRTFINPTTKLLTSTMTYILIIHETQRNL